MNDTRGFFFSLHMAALDSWSKPRKCEVFGEMDVKRKNR